MCKCNKNNRCRCNHNPCGCEKIDAKCVLYNGVCLSTLGICADTDLEEIVIIIDGLIQDIFEQIEQAWTAANIGGGAEVYKGISSLGIHMFRTLIDSVSVNVIENENNISLEVDEDWLEGVIIRLIDEAISNIPDTELDSPFNSISVTSSSTNEFDIDINPNTFTSPNGSVTITSNTLSGDLRINLQVNPSYINSLLPDITNVGSGADIYKGLNGNTHEFRGITTQVIQPSNPGQLSGSITAGAVVDGDNVRIDLDFSSLTATPQTFGIPEYYVNSNNPNNGDGSVVNPFKTWELCKEAIIRTDLGGTFHNPYNNGVKVIFQTNITSAEDLTVRNVTYNFQNDSVFTYIGATQGVIDMEKIVSSPTNTASINIQGTGEIRAYSPDPNTSAIVIRAAANNTEGHYYRIRFLGNSYITLREMYSDNLVGTHIELTDDGTPTGEPAKNGAGGPVYVVSKTGGTDRISVNEGVLSLKGRNTPVSEAISIENSATIRIASGVNRAIYIQDGVIAGYGSIILTSISLQGGLSNNSLVRYGGEPKETGEGRYKPSTTVSHILIDGGGSSDNSTLMLQGNGTLSGMQLGSTRQGGYNAIVEIKGQAILEVESSFTWNNHTRYNYLFYISDSLNPGVGRRVINLKNAYTRVYPENFIVGGVSGVNDTNTQLYIGNGGDVESNGLLTSSTDKIYHPAIEGNLTITSPFMLLTEKPYSGFGVTSHDDNSAALNWGLKPGMFYKTTDPTESILKIVQ